MTDPRPFWVSSPARKGCVRCRRTVKTGLRFDDVLVEASVQPGAKRTRKAYGVDSYRSIGVGDSQPFHRRARPRMGFGDERSKEQVLELDQYVSAFIQESNV
jgi:hypothetical protein